MSEMSPAEAIFFAAAVKPPAERADYLTEACAGDAKLRARVDRMLAAAAQVDSFLKPPINSENQEDASPSTGDLTALFKTEKEQSGTILSGRYKLLQLIGEGGMGSVWMADQKEPVKRRVAVKLIRVDRGNSKMILSRFEAERQAIALMDHPNIAKLLDAGTTDSGHPFFVMELVKGIPLTEYCDTHKLSVQQRLGLFQQICSAVQHAHQKGIIHRDLKPTNVLIESQGGNPVPKVIDFGLAKATSGIQISEHSLFTAFGSVMGTPIYMAPEQANFNAIDVDTRVDIYALGVMLYELLTGTTPLTRETVQKAGIDEMLKLVREQEAPTPSSRLSFASVLPSVAANRQSEPAKLGRYVKGELDWIVLKALSKERDRRYETANGFAMDIARFLNHEPVAAGPPSSAYRLKKFVQRNRGQVIAAGLVLISLVIGVIGTSWGRLEARQQRDTAVRERDEKEKARESEEKQRQLAVRSANEAKAVSSFLTEDLLNQADPDKNAQDKHITIVELLHRAEQRIEGNPLFVDRPEIEATLRLTIGKTFFKLGLYPEAERHMRRAMQLRQQVFGLDNLETLAAREALTDFLNGRLARPREAEPLAKETWAARSRLLGPEHRDTLDSLDTYAQVLRNLRRMKEAMVLHRQCFEARRRLLGPKDVDTLISMNNLGALLNDMGLWNESISLCKEVLKIHKEELEIHQVSPVGATSAAVTSVNLTAAFYMSGEQSLADRLASDQEVISSKLFGNDSPVTDQFRGLAVRIWCEQNRLEEAITRGREVVARRRKIYAPDHPLTANALLDLGRALALQGEFAEAELLEAEALTIYEKSPTQSEYFNGWAENWRGVALVGLNRWTDAEPLLISAEQRLRTNPMTPPRHYREALQNLATLYDAWNKPSEAMKWHSAVRKFDAENVDAKAKKE